MNTCNTILKSWLIYLPVFCAVICLTGCDFFNETPSSYLTLEETFATPKMVKNNALLAVYQYVGGVKPSDGLQGTTRGIYDLNSLTTDEQYIPIRGGDWFDGGYWFMLASHAWTETDESLYSTWNHLFKVITLATQNIELIEDAKDNFPEEAGKFDSYIAELRALRAMYYFYAMDLFGNIPIVTYDDMVHNTVKQFSRPEVYKYTIQELTSVLPMLEQSYSNREGSEFYGRVTRPVAEFVLAKLAINAAIYADPDWTDTDYPDPNSIMIPCGDDLLPAMDAVLYYANELGGLYSLEPDYIGNFKVYNEDSKENIFVIPVNYQLYNRCWFYLRRSVHYCHGAALGIGGENGTCATLETLKAFGYPDNPDPRFELNFYYEYVIEKGDTVYLEDGTTPLYYAPLEANELDLSNTPYEKTAGARIKKYIFDERAIADGTIGNNDIVLFRYADVLLMKAEALARKGIDATDIVNQVRQRVKAVPLAHATLDDIYMERWRELMWEGWHRNDMIRFHHFTDETSVNTIFIGTKSNYTTVFPIPQDILDMNPEWQQNKGYED